MKSKLTVFLIVAGLLLVGDAGSKFPWAEQSLQKASLKGVVAAIAEGLSLGRLAAAEVERF